MEKTVEERAETAGMRADASAEQLAEERPDKWLEVIDIEDGMKYGVADASATCIMSRSLLCAITCILVLTTTVIVLAIKVNGRAAICEHRDEQ